jgi:hypothetical protein
VRVQDAFGNAVTGSSAAVTLAITSLTGTPLATLSGGGPVTAALGVATFSSLSIDLAGLGYRLDALADGLTGATSSPFEILLTP